MAEREGGVVKKGHEEAMKFSLALLEEFGLPAGLVPLEEVEEAGFVRSTGYMWIVLRKKVEHTFKLIGKLASYDVDITGCVDKGRIRKLKGVKVKEFLMWVPIHEIAVDDNDPAAAAKVHFKSLAGVSKTFPAEAFAAGQ